MNAQADASSYTSAKKTVVVIDDSPTLCHVVKCMLEMNGDIFCRTFTNPGIAVKHILQNKPDMIVTDQLMPKVTGLDVIKSLRKHFDRMLLPIVVLTGKEEDMSFLTQVLHAGASDCIQKPVDYMSFVPRIQAQLA